MQRKTKLFFLGILFILFLSLISEIINAVPLGPTLNYVSNTTKAALVTNRSQDTKGTITTITLNSNQQSFKWKAYVGNVTGALVLDDANSKSIYDWAFATITGEVYVTRSSSVTWTSVSCVNQSVINSEQTFLGMASSMRDSMNSTFNYTTHASFLIGINNITADSCRSTATYINDSAQTVNDQSFFEEMLLMDTNSASLIYSTIIDSDQLSYNGVDTFDFQMLVAENESSTTPQNYYFFLELG